MCIIVALDKFKEISEETLRTCWETNDDGAGFMYAKDGRLIVEKGFLTWTDFINEWRMVPSSSPRVVHFRITTHGKSNEENCHPFNVTDRLAFAHNGVIHGVSNADKTMSDTWHFNEEIIKPMYKADGKFLSRVWNKTLLSNFIGGSKLVFLDHNGNMSFVNKEKGIQEDGVWYSNGSYKPKPLPYQQKSSLIIPEWMMEGSYVRIKKDIKDKRLKAGDLVYVNNVFGVTLEVLVHSKTYNGVLERKLYINMANVEEPDYGYGGSY